MLWSGFKVIDGNSELYNASIGVDSVWLSIDFKKIIIGYYFGKPLISFACLLLCLWHWFIAWLSCHLSKICWTLFRRTEELKWIGLPRSSTELGVDLRLKAMSYARVFLVLRRDTAFKITKKQTFINKIL